MAYEILANQLTLPAATDYSASQFRFMRVNSSGQWVRVGDGGDADGVLQNDPDATGRPGLCALSGSVTKVEIGGTVTAGNVVSSDSAGRAVNSASGDYILGRAITGATVAGTVVSIIFELGHSTL